MILNDPNKGNAKPLPKLTEMETVEEVDAFVTSRAESFTLSQFLYEWPEDWTFAQIVDELEKHPTDSDKVIPLEHYAKIAASALNTNKEWLGTTVHFAASDLREEILWNVLGLKPKGLDELLAQLTPFTFGEDEEEE